MQQNIQFIPTRASEAKDTLKSTNFGLYSDEFDLKKQHDHLLAEEQKLKCIHGDFKMSYYYDNGSKVDKSGNNVNKKKGKKGKSVAANVELNLGSANMSTASQSSTYSLQQARMRNTNQKYENSSNNYHMFLKDKTELPRLSILDNYKQINRIMTNSYIKGNEYQQKFNNRMAKDIVNDEEYMKFKEEEANTKKMATILKSLNHPIKMNKNRIPVGGSTRAVTHSYNGSIRTGIKSGQQSAGQIMMPIPSFEGKLIQPIDITPSNENATAPVKISDNELNKDVNEV